MKHHVWAGILAGFTLVAASGVPFSCFADSRSKTVSIPMVDDDGSKLSLSGRVCRPQTEAPSRVIVINHGSPPKASARPYMELERCDSETTKFFTSRGYTVVYALRRGYGDSDGDWSEGYGHCSKPNYVVAGLESARDIDAIVNFATALPFVRHDGAIVIGQSAGGWGTIAYASVAHPKVAGMIVMAGGRGGHMDGIPNENCKPSALVSAAGEFGKTAPLPMLWIYAKNDSYFAPDIAEALVQAFVSSGGKVTFVQPEAYGNDGHKEFFGEGGSKNWGAPVLQYLQSNALAP